MYQSNSLAAFGEDDFEAIEAALSETSRGRWFLSEYSRRAMQVETKSLIQSLVRLERVVAEQSSVPLVTMRRDVTNLARSISNMAREVVGDADVNDEGRNFSRIVADATAASAVIHHATDEIDSIATVMTEQNMLPEIADSIKRQTDVVREALTAHDINARRIRALAEMLDFTENRLKALTIAEEALDGLPPLAVEEQIGQ